MYLSGSILPTMLTCHLLDWFAGPQRPDVLGVLVFACESPLPVFFLLQMEGRGNNDPEGYTKSCLGKRVCQELLCSPDRSNVMAEIFGSH